MKHTRAIAAAPRLTRRGVRKSVLIRSMLAASALALWASAANAVTFTFSGTIASFTAPEDGAYQIDAWGAQGGPSQFPPIGGLGAMVGGRIQLHAGETLGIAVGGEGLEETGNTGRGGGGATWVVGPTGQLLLAAGGGGGAGFGCCAPGGPGQATQSGQGGGGGGGAGGVGGAGGGGGLDSGGGAGWFGPGGDADRISQGYGINGYGGRGLSGGLTDGCQIDFPPYEVCYTFVSGGFGGGGGAGYDGGGGGGGYSGGGGGGGVPGQGGGGGGSYIFDGFQNPIALSGVNSGNGFVTILPAPEPSAWALMLIGFGLAGAALRRHRTRVATKGWRLNCGLVLVVVDTSTEAGRIPLFPWSRSPFRRRIRRKAGPPLRIRDT